MNFHSIIFSNKLRDRYYRHISFWLLRFLILAHAIGIGMAFFLNFSIIRSISVGVRLAFYLTMVEIIFTLIVVYWLIPVFFRKHLFLFIVFFLVLTVAFLICASPVYVEWISLQKIPGFSFLFFWKSFTIASCWSFPILILFITLRLYKMHFQEIQRHKELLKENARAENQLLKAQIHPHFLFNTLNNIYSYVLNKKPGSAKLMGKLTDIFKYMVENSEAQKIPLSQELKMISDYIDLERVRFFNRLTVHFEVDGQPEGKSVVPLLILPFVENGFKHGVYKSWKPCWINILIKIKDHLLILDVSNSVPCFEYLSKEKKGIGQANVRKRLELFYPGKSVLEINNSEKLYSVHMTMPLEGEIEKGSEFNTPRYEKDYLFDN